MVSRFLIAVGVFVLLKKEEKILLQHRKNCSFSGCWGLVGGHLEANETIRQAAVRELKEEIGITVQVEDLTLKTLCHSFADQKAYLQFYFLCEKWTGTPQNKEPDKCDQLVFFRLKSCLNQKCHTWKKFFGISNTTSCLMRIFDKIF